MTALLVGSLACVMVAAGLFTLAGPGRRHALDTALYAALAKRDLATAAAAVALGADINARDLAGTPLVALFAADAHRDALAWLITQGADLEAVDREGNTPLMAASAEGEAEAARLLLAAGVAMRPNAAGRTPLQLALWGKHHAAARVLISAGAPLDTRDPEFDATTLLDAVDAGDVRTVDLLLDKGADLNAVDRPGFNALRKAAFTGQVALVERLLSRGAQVDARDKDGWTALMLASAAGHSAIVEVLLGAGADPRIADRQGTTALDAATRRGRLDTAARLRKALASRRLQHVDR